MGEFIAGTGLAALGLDALASTAYGPEAIVLALAAAGAAGIGLTLAIVAMLAVLVPSFAIGVFIGFALSQAGMVRHWLRERGRHWRVRLAINAIGAVLTAAAVVVSVEKFTDGAWLVVLVVPLLVAGFRLTQRAYDRIGAELGVDCCPPRPHRGPAVIIVPVVEITRLTEATLGTALSMGRDVLAVHVVAPDEAGHARDLAIRWLAWKPEVPLVLLDSPQHTLGPPIARFVRDQRADHVLVLAK
ncbi:MAG: hypothetical protein ACT4NY_01470 [Pseudonocardiales bacterium]